MKTAIPSTAKDAQNPATSSHAPLSRPQSGRLAQFAAMMNQSPRVRAQFKLAEGIQNSERVQKQMSVAAEINHEDRVAQAGSPSRAGFARDGVEAPSPVSFLDPIQNRSKTGTMPGVIAQRQPSEEPAAQREEAPVPDRTGLPDQLKSGVESLSDLSLDDVQVHYNSDKPAQLNALAYAQGTDIHVAPGQEKHLPHEAWHIVQQKEGRVQPTMQMKAGVPVNNDAGLEHEADVMGARAFSVSQSGAQPKLGDDDKVAQRKLQIQSESGKFTYFFGKDFKRDHIGGEDDAKATLRARFDADESTAPVTVISELDGDHTAVEVEHKSPYQFALTIDVDGHTASWDENNEPVAVAISSAILSGYIKKKIGLITHISASD